MIKDVTVCKDCSARTADGWCALNDRAVKDDDFCSEGMHPEINDTEISNCPFCGESARVTWQVSDGNKYYYVECNSCGARTNMFYLYPETAVGDWNHRI